MVLFSDLFSIILVAALTSLLLAIPAAAVAKRLGLIDVPGSAAHKRHHSPTVMGGGIALVGAMTIALAIFSSKVLQGPVGPIILGALLLVGWGLWDDRFGISPSWKLAGQFLAAGIVVALGVHVRLSLLPWVNWALTFIWLVGLTNAFNFVDSMDGLALGIGAIAAAFFLLVTMDSHQSSLAWLSASLLGATIGLYYHNAAPARLFLGDSGSQSLGFLLAGIALAYNPVGLPQGVSWFTPILVLGVPIFDMALVVYSRVRSGRPIYQAATDHTYHRLVALGLDPTRSVLSMQMAAILLGLIAFITLRTSVLVANAVFSGVVLLGVIAVLMLAHERRDGQQR